MSREYRDRVRHLRDLSADGDQTPSYKAHLIGIPCKILPKNGREATRGEQIESTVTHVLEMRFYSGILPDDIFENELTGDRYLVTATIDVDKRGRELIVHATEVVV